ncbi:MAG: hypothetical protein LBR32_00100 [Propionibacteriaceae bacterium]|jgi:hypothetical protein|nr:hypothetical protein [Propionibacteriaceae bacterium]
MDTEKLIDAVTKVIMERLAAEPEAERATGRAEQANGGADVVVFGDLPAGVLAPGVATRRGVTPSDVDGSRVVVLTIEAFRAFHSGMPAGVNYGLADSAKPCCGGGEIDLTGKRLVGESDLKGAGAARGATVRVCQKAILTALARDYASTNGLSIVRG